MAQLLICCLGHLRMKQARGCGPDFQPSRRPYYSVLSSPGVVGDRPPTYDDRDMEANDSLSNQLLQLKHSRIRNEFTAATEGVTFTVPARSVTG